MIGTPHRCRDPSRAQYGHKMVRVRTLENVVRHCPMERLTPRRACYIDGETLKNVANPKRCLQPLNSTRISLCVVQRLHMDGCTALVWSREVCVPTILVKNYFVTTVLVENYCMYASRGLASAISAHSNQRSQGLRREVEHACTKYHLPLHSLPSLHHVLLLPCCQTLHPRGQG